MAGFIYIWSLVGSKVVVSVTYDACIFLNNGDRTEWSPIRSVII